MLNDLIKLRNSKQPTASGNTDVIQFDYLFWTELEKIGKKNRAKALDAVRDASEKPDKPGTILASQRYKTVLKVGSPPQVFDKEVFIDEILKRCPEVSRVVLRECATAAVVDGTPRRTYTVEDMSDE